MRKFASILLILPMVAFARQPKAWLDPAPPSILKSHNWSPVAALFEVPASTLATAQDWLAKFPYVALKKSDVGLFGKPEFTCKGGTKPYLVRAQYITSGGSWFSLFWVRPGVLVVRNASIGTIGTIRQSAVVGCLSRVPSTVYSYIYPGVQ